MGTLRLWSADERTTRAIGAALADVLGPGDVVGLAGDLGAGKTRLVQGAAKARPRGSEPQPFAEPLH